MITEGTNELPVKYLASGAGAMPAHTLSKFTNFLEEKDVLYLFILL